jgi:FAD/FMN-containing dehydrogenase
MLNVTATSDLLALRTMLAGTIVAVGEPGYDEARRAWNLAVDQRPVAVVRAADVADVQHTVACAAAHGLRIAVQATGHRAAALPPLDGAILLRVDALRGVRVDPGARRAWVGAATPAADLVAAAAEHGLAAVVGSAKDVSVAGFALGGGLSFMGRRHGLGANQVTAIEVVTADGALRRVDADEETDLFWALRGTAGSLGVVTGLEVRLHEAGEVHAGMVVFDAAHAPALMRAWSDWAADAPDGITTSLKLVHVPPLPMFPEPLQGRSVVMVQGYALDGPGDAEALLGRLRAIAEPILGGFGPTALTALQDVHGDPEQPVPVAGRALPIAEVTDAAIEALLAAAAPGGPLMAVDLRQLGGALAAGAPDGGAMDRVEGACLAFAMSPVFDPAAVPAIEAGLDGLEAALAPWRAPGGVPTFGERPGAAEDLHGAAVAARLREIRAAYDPDRRFVVSHPA